MNLRFRSAGGMKPVIAHDGTRRNEHRRLASMIRQWNWIHCHHSQHDRLARQYGYVCSAHIELLFETMARHRVDEPWLFNINERLQYKRHSSIYGIVFLFKCFIENCIHSVSMYMLAIQIKLEINACLDAVLICLGYVF